MRQDCRGDRDEIVVTRLLIRVYYKSSLFLNSQNLSGESAEISIYKDVEKCSQWGAFFYYLKRQGQLRHANFILKLPRRCRCGDEM